MTLPNPYPKPTGPLRRDDSLKDVPQVRWLQFELQKRGIYIGRIDGWYGPKTEAAAKSAKISDILD